MARILIAEDEKPISELISRNLNLVGHTAEVSFDGNDALEKIKGEQFDLVLLDVMLPGLTGFEIKQQISSEVPVVFVTARDELNSRLEGLGLGADDYIIKPFEILELLARVEAVLRRTNRQQLTFEYCGARIEFDTHQIFVNGTCVSLTPKEYDLLETLVINRNLALSREKLLELVWGFDYEGESRTVDMHILRLRKKLGWEECIQTVYKMGYRLNTRI